MISNRITSADLVGVTGYSRHKLRSFLKELPGYSDTVGAERVARQYSVQELLVIAVCCELEQTCGLRRDLIGSLEAEIRAALITPHLVSSTASLVLKLSPVSVEYQVGAVTIESGTILPLKNILERINAHLGGGNPVGLDGQQFLDFGPVGLGRTKAQQTPQEKKVAFGAAVHEQGRKSNAAR